MNDIEELKYIKINHFEKIEEIVLEEIEQFKQMILEELNQNEKIKLEEIEHLEQIKLSQMEHFDEIKEEEKFSNMQNIIFDDIEAYEDFLSKLFKDLELFSKNEIENLERIEKDEIESLKKRYNNETLKLQCFIKERNLEHQKFFMQEIQEHRRKINYFDGIKMKIRIEGLEAGPPKYVNKYQNNTKIRVKFYKCYSENEINEPPIIIECSLNDKIGQLIEKYYEKIGNISHNKKFLFENNILFPEGTVGERYLYDGCSIKVINS